MAAPRDKRSQQKLAAFASLALAILLAAALSGCSLVTDYSTTSNKEIGDLATETTDIITESASSLTEAWDKSDAYSAFEEFASISTLSKNGAIVVSSGNEEKLYENREATDILAAINLERWTPVTAEEFQSRTCETAPSVNMTLSQDKTVLLDEDSSSGRLNVASISFWPNEQMAKFEVTVDASEGVYLFGDIGITTKENTALITLYFRTPTTVSSYIADL